MTPSKLTGEMLKAFRSKLGMSQKDMAEKVGISEGSWLNYERECRKEGKVLIPKLLDWALAAVSAGLRPFSEMNLNKKK